jgi:hypothetical protein
MPVDWIVGLPDQHFVWPFAFWSAVQLSMDGLTVLTVSG